MHVTQNQTFACILQSECSEKNRKGSKIMPMSKSILVILPYGFIKTRFHQELFPKHVWTISQHSTEQLHLRNLFSKPKIIVVMELCKGNCQNLLIEIL